MAYNMEWFKQQAAKKKAEAEAKRLEEEALKTEVISSR